MKSCPNCESTHLVAGRLTGETTDTPLFRPASLRRWSFTLSGGVHLDPDARACLDCGLIVGHLSQERLKRFVEKHCDERPRG